MSRRLLGRRQLSGVSRDPRWNVLSGQTSIDEFNDDTIDAAWVRVDASGKAGNMTLAEGGDVLSVFNNGGDASAEYHGIVRPLSGVGGSMVAGDAFITCATMHALWATGIPLGGLVLSDGTTHGSGNQVLLINYADTTGAHVDLRGGSSWTSDAGAVSTIGVAQGPPTYLRLVMTAANTWRADTSLDGVSWRIGTPTTSKTITPTHVGYISSNYAGTSTKFVFSYEFLRRVAGVS